MPQTLAPENRAVSSAQQCSTSPAIQVQITLDWRRSAASGISPQGQPSVIKPRKKENNPFTAHSLKRSTEHREHWLPWKDCTAFLCTSSERSAEMIPCSIIIQICLPSAFTQCGTPSSHESSVLPGEKYSDKCMSVLYQADSLWASCKCVFNALTGRWHHEVSLLKLLKVQDFNL